MKNLVAGIIILVIPAIGLGQELVMIKDTINNFQIGVPVGWMYGVPKDKSVDFIAFRQKTSEQDMPRENFNINIFRRDETDMEKSYQHFIRNIGSAEDFSIVAQQEKVINRRRYKYLVETHKNAISKEEMTNCVLFTNNDGEILILTMVTTSLNFPKYKQLFDSIVLSLHY